VNPRRGPKLIKANSRLVGVETTKPFSLLADSEPDVADKGKQSSEVETTNPVPAVENAEARKLMTQGTQSSWSKPLSGLVLNSDRRKSPLLLLR